MKNDPAFPIDGSCSYGLSKREYFSVRIMAALLSDLDIKLSYNEVAKKTGQMTERVIAGVAIHYADILISELEKK